MKLPTLICIALLGLGSIANINADAQSKQPESAPAQDVQAETNKTGNSDKQAPKAKANDELEKSNRKPPKKVFKPTEEISEDLPVPFPIDI